MDPRAPYIPDHFRVTDEDELFGVIERSGLATVVSVSNGVPVTTQAPFAVSRDESGARRVWGHVARANPQSRALAEGSPVLVLFRGPDAYVSPSWYTDSPNVPTWNFVVVHAYGTTRPVASGDPTARWILERTVAKHESSFERPWQLDDAPASYVESLVEGVAAFELEVSSLHGQFKLSQNQPTANRLSVIRNLERQPESGARGIARLMAEQETRRTS